MKADNEIRIAFFGDSISEVGRSSTWHGGASERAANWGALVVKWIEARTDRPVVYRHYGIGGQNTYEGLGRLETLASFSPSLVVVAFGANDCCHHFLLPEETKLALVTMLGQIREQTHADAVVVGTGGDNPLLPFFRHLNETLAAQKEAANECSVPFVDIRSAILQATENGAGWADFHLGPDNCHPNDQGHRIWADTFVRGSWISRLLALVVK